jgi:type II secretory pathway pseudopilin PulG
MTEAQKKKQTQQVLRCINSALDMVEALQLASGMKKCNIPGRKLYKDALNEIEKENSDPVKFQKIIDKIHRTKAARKYLESIV